MSQAFWDSESGGFSQFVFDIGESSLWDTAFIGGVQLPGIVKIEGEIGRKWDVKTAPGTDGATITDQGYEPAKPTITLTIWTPEHWREWQTLLPFVAPKAGKGTKRPPPPVPLSHPGMNALGVNAIIVLSVSAPKPGSVKGSMEITIKCVQWLKPKKAVVRTPANLTNGTTSGNTGGFAPGFIDPISAPSKGAPGPT